MNRQSSALLPFYLVVDVSWSMSLAGKIEAVGDMASAIIDALVQDPVASTTVRFGLVEFSDDARIRLPLDGVASANGVAPELTVRAGTSFQSVFALLEDAIPADLARLATTRTLVRRPTVFLLTDGEPTDDERGWRSAFASLTALPARPSIVPCGVDQATVRVMSELVHPRSRRHSGTLYMMDPTYPPAQAITAFADIVISSMLASSRRSDGRAALPTARRVPPGLTRHRITAPSQPAGRGGHGRDTPDRPYRRVGQNGSVGFPIGRDHGTMW
ncbi:MAG TPA: VWA domain-containing protein [Micromonosporaceae bacterium]|nr:VWA domain-containing protein [Micromonosporaceae bacterium]